MIISNKLLKEFYEHLEIPGTAVQVGGVNNIIRTANHGENFAFAHIASNIKDKDLYFLGGIRPGVTDRAKDDDIILKNYIVLDFDIRETLKKKGLECDEHQMAIEATGIREYLRHFYELKDFSYSLLSGNGLHIYYFGDPVKIQDKEIFKLGMKRVIEMTAQCPVRADSACINPARIFRMPGSINHKNGANYETQLIDHGFKKSNLINLVIQYGRELKLEQEVNSENNKSPKENQSDNIFTAINKLDIAPIVCERFNWECKDRKFYDQGSTKPKACFVSEKNSALLIHGGTDHINPVQKGFNPFQFVELVYGLSKSGTINWFINRYPELKPVPIEQPAKNNEAYQKLVITTSQEMLEAVTEPEPFIIEGLIPQNAVTAITAGSGKGKSLFMLILAYYIASGKSLFDTYKTNKNKVLIIDQEMNRNTIIERYQAIMAEAIDIDYIYEQSWHIDKLDQLETLKRQIIAGEYGVLIFDTFVTIHSGQENDSGEMKKINQYMLELIRETGITIIYLHHHRKENGQPLSQSSSRGSTEIIAKVASHLVLDSHKPEITDDGKVKLLFTLTQEKSRLPAKFNKIQFETYYEKTTNKTTWLYLGEKSADKYDQDEIKCEIIEQIGTSTMSFNDIKTAMTDNGLSIGANKIREILTDLVSGKYLTKEKGQGKFHNTDYYSVQNLE